MSKQSLALAIASAFIFTSCNATNSAIPGRAQSSISTKPETVTAVSPPTTTLSIDSGGPVSGPWVNDADYVGGTVSGGTSHAIDTSQVPNPAPQKIYQTGRFGSNFSYAFTGLTPGVAYTIRLHFAEYVYSSIEKRVFDVAINGEHVLAHFDIYKAASGKNKAIVREFSATASSSGTVSVNFTSTTDHAIIQGIELSSPSPYPSPSPSGSPSASPSPSPSSSPIASPTPIAGTLLDGIVSYNNSSSTIAGWTSYFCPRQPNLVEVYNTSGDNSSYASLTSALNSRISEFAGHAIMWTIYSTPKGETLSSVAAGGGDVTFTAWAKSILAGATLAPDGNIYVRTDWEQGLTSGTGNWQTQGNAHPATVIGAFQHFSSAFHAVSPKFKIVWDTWPGRTPSNDQGGTDNSVYYPGDSYVDVMSEDLYINGTSWSTGTSAWNYLQNVSNGVGWLTSFSTAHGKPMAFSEWNADNASQGDRVASEFSNSLFNWSKAHNVRYEIYYDIGSSRIETDAYPLTGSVFKSQMCP